MLAPVVVVRIGASAIFTHVGASSTIPSLQAGLQASTHAISLDDEGVGGSCQVIDQ
jgi:hypothetical protein